MIIPIYLSSWRLGRRFESVDVPIRWVGFYFRVNSTSRLVGSQPDVGKWEKRKIRKRKRKRERDRKRWDVRERERETDRGSRANGNRITDDTNAISSSVTGAHLERVVTSTDALQNLVAIYLLVCVSVSLFFTCRTLLFGRFGRHGRVALTDWW